MAQSKVFSLSEVSLHCSTRDCWLIINGNVYDVTGFLNEHPGGEDPLIQNSGGDATKAFEDIGHSSTASSMMSSYHIGVLGSNNSGDLDRNSSESVEFEVVESSKRGEMAAKVIHEEKSGALVSFSGFLVSVFIIGVAFGVWFLLNKDKA